MKINFLLFENFTALDAFGPAEVLNRVEGWQTRFLSINGGIIKNGQGISIMTEPTTEEDLEDIWLIPGGWGTRQLVNDERFLDLLRQIAEKSKYCLTVCTGSALLAKCGALDGRQVTSNKKAFDWVVSVSDKVQWLYKKRWVADGKFYTSAGVSAGIDMALGFVCQMRGKHEAENIAKAMEYRWNTQDTI